jgi:outer membrane protein
MAGRVDFCQHDGDGVPFQQETGMFPCRRKKKIMLKNHIVAAAFLTVFACGAALAQDFKAGDLLVRARAVNLDSANKDSTGLNLSINNKTLPEVDFSYFMSPTLAAELVLTVPQKHTVSAGAAAIGSLRHLPPTLTVQYHFNAGGFKPYLGAGLNYTRFSSVNLPAGVDIKRNSFGMALQAGVDIALAKDLYLNIDVKKVQIGTKVSVAGTEIGQFKVNPLLVGVGLGWRF